MGPSSSAGFARPSGSVELTGHLVARGEGSCGSPRRLGIGVIAWPMTIIDVLVLQTLATRPAIPLNISACTICIYIRFGSPNRGRMAS